MFIYAVRFYRMRKLLFALLLLAWVPGHAQLPQVRVSVPFHTIHSGEVAVPLSLHYSPGGGWRFEAGTVREDDAGNRVEFTDSTIHWPQGFITMRPGSMEVFDNLENPVKSISFERLPDGRLSRLWTDRDTTAFSYQGNGIRLHRAGRGSTAYQFDSLDRVVSVIHDGADGTWRSQQLEYLGDTLTVRARDSVREFGKTVFLGDPKVYRVDEFDPEERLIRSTEFHYQGDFPAGETIRLFGTGEGKPLTSSRRLRYSPDSPYPVEESVNLDNGESYRATFTYAPHRPDALLSLTRWDGSRMIDSTRLVYASFPGHAGRVIRRPSALLYGRAGEPLDTCIRFISYDFNGVHTYRSKRMKQFYPDARMSRLTVQSPSIDLEKELRARLLSAGMPFAVDPLEGGSFLFDTDGAFLSRVRGTTEQVLFYQGFAEEPVTASFADPDHDPSLIDSDCWLQLITPADVALSMHIVDAHNPRYRGLIRGCLYLLRESGYGGLIDPAVNAQHQVFPKVWYLSETRREGALAHNHFNTGNFLWGAAAQACGVPLWVTLLGTHFNNFFLSPDNQGRPDDKDDVLSIRAGYHILRP